MAWSFEGHIDPFAGAGAGGFSLWGAIPGSRQDGVHIQRGCIPILSPSDGIGWQTNGEPSLTNSENRKLKNPTISGLEESEGPKGSVQGYHTCTSLMRNNPPP
jgi:hypothetical protein